MRLVPRDELVEVHDDTGYRHPGGRLIGGRKSGSAAGHPPGRLGRLTASGVQPPLRRQVNGQSLQFLGGGSTGQAPANQPVQAFDITTTTLGQRPCRQGLGALEKDRIVEQCQGLQRRVGTFATGAGLSGTGRVEGCSLSKRRRPLHERVQAAPVAVDPDTFGPHVPVGLAGNALRLGRPNTRSLQVPAEQARGLQGGVADDLCRKPQRPLPSQQAVARIPSLEPGTLPGRLPIRAAGHDQPVQLLQLLAYLLQHHPLAQMTRPLQILLQSAQGLNLAKLLVVVLSVYLFLIVQMLRSALPSVFLPDHIY